ncbi:ribonucleoside diphosphate reductase [Ostreococcus lucimarinus virus OlV6]|uniref:ribonucleotide reductase n=1 Tax=Ostreococcus tauri virus 2 TaxID=696472 RepID=UPI0001EF4654|nr:ribonucleotide reductase [Ostreococcus tauri virus 2]AFK65871.1 ribonucleoside diphosphate reductase [Ostreococcus lucimarinus virus OlV6]CBI70122.1 ribonucleoside-diphosphate reductase, alpha subunit [Ostreococcus tauri virus 2]
MRVVKRSGRIEDMKFDNITNRIKNLTYGLSENCDSSKVAQQVASSLYDGITVQEIDTLSAEVCIGLITSDPDYEILATRITASNIQKVCPNNFHIAMKKLAKAGIVTEEVARIAGRVRDDIDTKRDYDFGYFGLKTLEKSYLQRLDGILMETPQYMFMRVAIGIHGEDIDSVLETYDKMSQGMFIHATPTLFNAGTPRPQMSSCFLIANKEDSINGIYGTLTECAQISKWAGGIGMHIHDVRANKSRIRGTNGQSDGIIPMLRVFNATARYVNQAGRRKGSIAVYLEPWHADIMEFLELRLNQGDEEARCRDLFSSLWIPDLFMKRVEEGGQWSLFCPDKAPGLSDAVGEEFEALYTKYEAEGRANAIVPAADVWKAILKSQTETGTPYMLYKDACNKKSNQKNLGTIKSSNLCTEILEYTDKDETAVCNLASIALPKYVNEETRTFDYEKLHEITKIVTKNLNRVIDRNFYPVETARKSNMRHRPIGLGVQGLADVFILCRYAFDSDEAKEMNARIFETMYHASLEASCELAEAQGSYETFEGSPTSQGVLQFDMWEGETKLNYDWDVLKERIKEKGLRNSLLMAPMPTASTAQILGNNECFEPYTTNIYLRRTLAGEFVIVNKHLVNDLKKIGLWSKDMKDLMVKAGGSIQNISDIPDDIKNLYRTVWEIKMKDVIDMAAQRGRFIDQSQSMNLFMESPTMSKLSSMHMYAWKQGLKTGMYYLRSKAKARPIQFSLEPECVACSA